ncbi:MAG: carbohydrate kinase family protein [Spirochaetales bacterium]|nr:carbohydrate kinase family protein [Spirochaetales bacterium]
MRRVHFTGCCLIDYIFNTVVFISPEFRPFLSKRDNDGGIVPGRLVFSDVFETFTRRPVAETIGEITRLYGAPVVNLGGPGAVAAIHASQMLSASGVCVRFFGGRSRDAAGAAIGRFFSRTDVDYRSAELPGETPKTWVFSDPSWNEGKGERAFLGQSGSAALYGPSFLGQDFFDADINVWGGTALVPGLHTNLSALLYKGTTRGNLQIVHTVYDFFNQRRDPSRTWPMGDSDEAYRHIDLIITDREEALRLSGRSAPPDAVKDFLRKGAGAAIVTDGENPVWFAAAGGRFTPVPPVFLPVSREALRVHAQEPFRLGDTTGCGDNFAGGVISALALQVMAGETALDLRAAVPHGIAAGAFACLYPGGPFFEEYPGQKRKLMIPFYNDVGSSA